MTWHGDWFAGSFVGNGIVLLLIMNSWKIDSIWKKLYCKAMENDVIMWNVAENERIHEKWQIFITTKYLRNNQLTNENYSICHRVRPVLNTKEKYQVPQ